MVHLGEGARADHPRIRGEHLPGSLGSDQGCWIIPAYAGSTFRAADKASTASDHPRIRGEHENLPAPGQPGFGSSPHTRGAPHGAAETSVYSWIIPAYAGSTSIPVVASSSPADHPRIRGEHGHPDTRLLNLLGSSPHTRGARGINCPFSRRRRIIPAYAGSTSDRSATAGSGGDHPRIRGEHETDTTTSRLRAGSSPHTRGALQVAAFLHLRVGIIPAYAGSTRPTRRQAGYAPDHPRIRGEHLARGPVASRPVGSSPHTRGALGSGPDSGRI